MYSILIQAAAAGKGKKSAKDDIIQIDNMKEFKKLLRTRKNVLISFFKSGNNINFLYKLVSAHSAVF